MSTTIQSITSVVSRHMESGKIPGAITLVAQGGKLLHLDARGVVRGTNSSMKEDSIFWLASLSKPMTSAAILMLMDEGKVSLDDPASKYIPEFKVPRKVRVFGHVPGVTEGMLPAVSLPGANDVDPPHELVDAQREAVVRDFLTHTAGIQTIAVANTAIPELLATDRLGDWVAKCAGIPHDFQPGSRWAYSNSVGFDVLARIVEVASGQSFDAFLKDRLFRPLGMDDVGFNKSGDSRALALEPLHQGKLVSMSPIYKSGSSGLWGSARDCWKFGEMLRTKGGNILSRDAFQAMTSNQVGDLFPGLNGRRRTRGLGFGLAVAVMLDAATAGIAMPNGSFGWDGVGARRLWVDPKNDRVVFMYVPDPDVQADIEEAVSKLS